MYGYNLGVKKAPSGGGGGAIAPSNLTAPVISGSTTLGSTLTTTDGTWSGTPTPTFTYQWYRGASPISGATSTTYVTTLADSTANITCQVTATNSAGSATATSNTITLPSYAPVNTVAPVISGTAVVGQTLTTTNGTWTNSPSSYSYQWKRGATNIGTNSSTYTLVQADAGNISNITCVVTATNSAGSANATSNQIAQILTVRTNSFLSASSISDATIRGALNNLDIGLISNSIDTRARAIYPFVGGTATTHKWNFMDAQDTNAAFRLTFSGTWTHSSTGALPNGTNAFADPYFTPSTNASTSGVGHGIYSRTDSVSGTRVYGCVTGGATILQHNIASGNFVSGSVTTNIISYTASPTTRFLYNRRNSTTDMQAYRDGSSLGTNTNTCSALPSSKFYFGARNGGSGTPDFYDNHEISFAILDIGLTNTQALTLRTLVDNFQLALGRNI